MASKIEVAWEPPGQPTSGTEGGEPSSGRLRIVWRKQTLAALVILGVLLFLVNALCYWGICYAPMTERPRAVSTAPTWFLLFWIWLDVMFGSFLLYFAVQRTYIQVDRENLVVARRLPWPRGCAIPVSAIGQLDLRACPITVYVAKVRTTQTVWEIVAELEGGETMLLEGYIDDPNEGRYVVELLRRALAELGPQPALVFWAAR